MKLASATLLALLTLTGISYADQPQPENPFTAPVENPFSGPVNPFVDSELQTDINVDKTRESRIERPERQITNPTGQVSDQEFDGLIQRGGR